MRPSPYPLLTHLPMGMGGYWVPMGMGTHCRTHCSFIFAFSLKSFIQWVNQDYANFSSKFILLIVTRIHARQGSHQEQKCICKSQIHGLNYVRWVSVRHILVIFYKENNTTKREREATGKGRRWGGLQSEPAPHQCTM